MNDLVLGSTSNGINAAVEAFGRRMAQNRAAGQEVRVSQIWEAQTHRLAKLVDEANDQLRIRDEIIAEKDLLHRHAQDRIAEWRQSNDTLLAQNHDLKQQLAKAEALLRGQRARLYAYDNLQARLTTEMVSAGTPGTLLDKEVRGAYLARQAEEYLSKRAANGPQRGQGVPKAGEALPAKSAAPRPKV